MCELTRTLPTIIIISGKPLVLCIHCSLSQNLSIIYKEDLTFMHNMS